jgi:hypothetical protein
VTGIDSLFVGEGRRAALYGGVKNSKHTSKGEYNFFQRLLATARVKVLRAAWRGRRCLKGDWRLWKIIDSQANLAYRLRLSKDRLRGESLAAAFHVDSDSGSSFRVL